MRIVSTLALGLALALGGCGGGGGGGSDSPPPPDPMAEFSLPDVNPASATVGTDVSPRDLLGMVSVWYFGHST